MQQNNNTPENDYDDMSDLTTTEKRCVYAWGQFTKTEPQTKASKFNLSHYRRIKAARK